MVATLTEHPHHTNVECRGCGQHLGTYANAGQASAAQYRHNHEMHRYFVEVCTDCYFAHHGLDEDRGLHEHEGKFYELRADGSYYEVAEPLSRIDDTAHVFDATDSETGEGIDEFSWSSCEGCGSHLGGARYRLMIVPMRDE